MLRTCGRAEFVTQNFKNIGFDKARKSQMDALLMGFAVSEIIWEASEGSVVVADFRHRKPWRFVWTKEGQLRMLTEENMIEGVEVPRHKFWVFVHDQKYESCYGRPLGQTLFWPYWFKKSDIKWWLVFNEKFGSPTTVGKYPANTSAEQQEKLLDALKAIQQETAVTVPEGMVIELLEAARRGSIDTYKTFVDWAENLQSKIVLGQTLTTQQGDTGAMALGQVHDQVRGELTKADCDDLCESINNDVIKQLVDFNFPQNKNGYPKLWIRTDAEKDLKSLAERDKLITDMGFSLTEEYIRDTYDVEAKPVPRGLQSRSPFAFAENQDIEGDDDDNVGPFVQRAVRQTKHDPLVDPVLKILNESKDLTEFKERLQEAHDDMDVTELAELMQTALETAHLTGAFEALPEKDKAEEN